MAHTPSPNQGKDVAGALGAPARRPTPRTDPTPAADDSAPPRSPADPGSMHRSEDDDEAKANSRDFADDVPPPEAAT
jgi:hypothetical protein